MHSPSFLTAAKIAAAMGAALCLAFPVLTAAQQEPYPQQPGPYPQQPGPYPQQQGPPPQQQGPPDQAPSYAQPPAPTYAHQGGIKGVVTGFDGQWIVYMHDDKGYTDHITLHQGTMINPTGIRLIEGMRVTVYGSADGPTYQADRIDVASSPYSPYYGYGGNPYGSYYPNGGYGGYGYGGYGGYGGYPYGGYGAYPYGYGYGYPYYGYGYPYGYGWGWPWGFGLGVNWGWGWGWGWRGGGRGWGGWGGRPGNGGGGTVHGTIHGRPPR